MSSVQGGKFQFLCLFSAKSEGRRTIRFRMGHDTSNKLHNIPVSDVNIPKSRIKYDVLLDAKEVGNSSNSFLDHT